MAEDYKAELMFMYKKYEELCIAYKELARKTNKDIDTVAHTMDHMSFDEN